MSTTVRLTPHAEALLQKQLEKGRFRSPEEVLERALETLETWSDESAVPPSGMTPA